MKQVYGFIDDRVNGTEEEERGVKQDRKEMALRKKCMLETLKAERWESRKVFRGGHTKQIILSNMFQAFYEREYFPLLFTNTNTLLGPSWTKPGPRTEGWTRSAIKVTQIEEERALIQIIKALARVIQILYLNLKAFCSGCSKMFCPRVSPEKVAPKVAPEKNRSGTGANAVPEAVEAAVAEPEAAGSSKSHGNVLGRGLTALQGKRRKEKPKPKGKSRTFVNIVFSWQAFKAARIIIATVVTCYILVAIPSISQYALVQAVDCAFLSCQNSGYDRKAEKFSCSATAAVGDLQPSFWSDLVDGVQIISTLTIVVLIAEMKDTITGANDPSDHGFITTSSQATALVGDMKAALVQILAGLGSTISIMLAARGYGQECVLNVLYQDLSDLGDVDTIILMKPSKDVIISMATIARATLGNVALITVGLALKNSKLKVVDAIASLKRFQVVLEDVCDDASREVMREMREANKQQNSVKQLPREHDVDEGSSIGSGDPKETTKTTKTVGLMKQYTTRFEVAGFGSSMSAEERQQKTQEKAAKLMRLSAFLFSEKEVVTSLIRATKVSRVPIRRRSTLADSSLRPCNYASHGGSQLSSSCWLRRPQSSRGTCS